MKYVWDEAKNRINQKKHNISFEEAVTVIQSADYAQIMDDSIDEFRFKAIESIDPDSVVFVKGKVPSRSQPIQMTKSKKESRFTARVSEQDFEDFKKISVEKGTLIQNFNHNFYTSLLTDSKR